MGSGGRLARGRQLRYQPADGGHRPAGGSQRAGRAAWRRWPGGRQLAGHRLIGPRLIGPRMIGHGGHDELSGIAAHHAKDLIADRGQLLRIGRLDVQP